MATKTSTKNKSTLKGTSAADVLTVKHDQVTVTGAGGNDTIKITKGNSSKVSGDAGKDTITVSAGKSHTIHGNAANDTITIGKSAGTGIKAYGDAGNDTIKATNSYAVTFYGGDGSDTLTGGKGGDKLYGQAGADKLYGGAGNDTLSGGAGDDKLYGQAGTDTLTGGAGKDTFVYASGGGSDKITDYAAGYDTLQISSGSISKTALANSSKDLVFTVGTGKVTLSNGAAKTISLKDSRGSYKVSKTGITLGSNFTGTMDTAKYLSTVTTVNGKSSAKTVTIKGNAKANTIYGGSGANTVYGYGGNDKLYGYAGADKLYGGDGDDTLYGGAGTDTLTGGAGKDTFVYANGEGSDTIKDYAAGSDTLQISSGSISKTALANSDKDLVFTVGSGKVTLTGAAAKTISLKDSRGSYTVSETAITLGSNFSGTMDATKYLASVKIIDGRNATKTVNITGNAQDNIIYAGKAGGTMNGGAGNNTLYGGAGKDTFNHTSGTAVIKDFQTTDSLVLENAATEVRIGKYSNSDESILSSISFITGTQDKITVEVDDYDYYNQATNKLTSLQEHGKTVEFHNLKRTSTPDGPVLTVTMTEDFADRPLVTDNVFYSYGTVKIDASSVNSGVTVTSNLFYGYKAYITGSAGNDIITVKRDENSTIYMQSGVHGGAGDDVITGSDGCDQLNGGTGNDTLTGGGGGDTFIIDADIYDNAIIGTKTIADYSADDGDLIRFNSDGYSYSYDNYTFSYDKYTVKGNDVYLTPEIVFDSETSLAISETVIIVDGKGKTVNFESKTPNSSAYNHVSITFA